MKKVADFAKLLSPISPADFFRDSWEKRYLHIARNQPGYFDDVISIAEIDGFLSRQNLAPEGIKLMKSGEAIPVNKWTKTETLIDGTTQKVINIESFFKQFNKGATIIINAAQKSIPRLARTCRLFEQQLKIRVQANIYLTPPQSQGFAMHYDPHDIFLMQIKGPKNWNIYDSGEHLPTNYRAFNKEPALIAQLQINSGDFLYLPRGTTHEAFSSEVSTIHLNFSCKARFGFHLLQDLAQIAEKEEAFFRLTVPYGAPDKADLELYAQLFTANLQRLIAKTGTDRLLESGFDDFVKNQILDFEGRLLNSLQLESLNLNTIVCRRKEFTCSVKQAGSETRITFGGLQVKIPAFVEKEMFLQDEPFKVNDIKGLISAQGKLSMVREFVETGFLEITQLNEA